MRTDQEVEDNWNNKWKEIFQKEDGSIDVEQLKKELMDFSDLIHNATTVYCHVTGNRLSYPTYPAKTVIGVYEEYLEELQQYWEEDFREENDCACGIEINTKNQGW